MAIDSAEKRRSAAGAGVVTLLPGVTPNASKPVAWRQQAAWGYSGIAAGEPEEPEFAIATVYLRVTTPAVIQLNAEQ